MKKILKNKKGFTLVELIVVIAILGILAVVMVPQFTKYIAKAQNANTLSAAKAYCTAYQAAYADTHGGTEAEIAAALTELGATKPDLTGTTITIDDTKGDGTCTVSE
ncbi:MAG: pilin [Erysipelotrichaceae bacterium]